MRKLFLSLLIAVVLAPLAAYAQKDDQTGAYLEAQIQPTAKELRKHRKKMMVEREIDSLIVSRDFKFEPVQIYTFIQPIFEFSPRIYRCRDCGGPTVAAKNSIIMCSKDYVWLHWGWFETKLFHEWLPLDDHRIYGLNSRNPAQARKMSEIRLELPLPTDNFKFTESTKEEDKTWFITIEVDRIGQICKYEFVVQPTGWTVLRCTSNRWGGSVIYTGWLVRT